MELLAMFLTGFVLGTVLAGLSLVFWMRAKLSQLEAAKAIAEAKLSAAEAATAKIGETFQALADAALRSSQGAFLEAARGTLETIRAEMSGDLAQRQTAVEGVVAPLTVMVDKLESQIREMELARQQMFGGLQEQLQSLTKETATLANALRAPHVRGRWGEVTLKRVAELAGMVEYCDFVEQETVQSNAGRLRPDMIVRLPGGRSLVVDAKVPLTAYLEAIGATEEVRRREALMRHSQQVFRHVEQLSSKQYWSQFQPTPDLVILFIPGDQFFSAALEYNPTLIEDALERKVLLATPTTLISVLKGISYGWRQQQLAENAEQIRRVASEFFDRAQVLQNHFADTGRYLDRAVEAYNRTVASWEARLIPSLRRMRDLGAVTGDDPVAPEQINLVPRKLGIPDAS
jgi:DNA recombination protein RmuC